MRDAPLDGAGAPRRPGAPRGTPPRASDSGGDRPAVSRRARLRPRGEPRVLGAAHARPPRRVRHRPHVDVLRRVGHRPLPPAPRPPGGGARVPHGPSGLQRQGHVGVGHGDALLSRDVPADVLPHRGHGPGALGLHGRSAPSRPTPRHGPFRHDPRTGRHGRPDVLPPRERRAVRRFPVPRIAAVVLPARLPLPQAARLVREVGARGDRSPSRERRAHAPAHRLRARRRCSSRP